jgi:hypothetical protein
MGKLGTGVKAAIDSAGKLGADVDKFDGYKNFAKVIDDLEDLAGDLGKDVPTVITWVKSPNPEPKTDFKKFFKKQKEFQDKAWGMAKAAVIFQDTADDQAKATKDKKQQAALAAVSNMCRPITIFLDPKSNVLFKDLKKDVLTAWEDKKKEVQKSSPQDYYMYAEAEKKYIRV